MQVGSNYFLDMCPLITIYSLFLVADMVLLFLLLLCYS